MRNMAFLALVCLVTVISISCASAPIQRQQNEDTKVLVRAKELIDAMSHRDFGKVWDMATPWHRQELSHDGSREGYVKWVSKFFEHVKVTDYGSLKLVVLGEKHAITQMEMTYEFREGDQVLSLIKCERTIWLKSPDEWYWTYTALSCDYMPDANMIESLTKEVR